MTDAPVGVLLDIWGDFPDAPGRGNVEADAIPAASWRCKRLCLLVALTLGGLMAAPAAALAAKVEVSGSKLLTALRPSTPTTW